MTDKEYFAWRMEEISKERDIEGSHIEADRLMCATLRKLGYEEGVKIFEAMDKWYA